MTTPPLLNDKGTPTAPVWAIGISVILAVVLGQVPAIVSIISALQGRYVPCSPLNALGG